MKEIPFFIYCVVTPLEMGPDLTQPELTFDPQ